LKEKTPHFRPIAGNAFDTEKLFGTDLPVKDPSRKIFQSQINTFLLPSRAKFHVQIFISPFLLHFLMTNKLSKPGHLDIWLLEARETDREKLKTKNICQGTLKYLYYRIS
jgi:hypothetical protein